MTELGFVRISSNKKVIPHATTPADALAVLWQLCQLPGHEFWPDATRLTEPPFTIDRMGSHLQVTDVHLAAIAAKRKARLLTFDRGIQRALPPDEQRVVSLLTAT